MCRGESVPTTVSGDILLYANLSKGYKAGSFLFTNASTTAQFQPVVQESVVSYEVGFKASLLDYTMQLNGAAFYYDSKDKQLRGKLNDPVFGVLDALVNVPESRLQGAALSLDYLPLANLSLSLAASYVDSEVTDYVGVGFNGGIRDFDGSSIPFSPDWSLVASAEYSFPLSTHWEGFIGGNVNHNGETYAAIGDDRDALIDAYTPLDLRAGVRSLDQRYTLSLFGHNVTDEWYYVNAPVLYDTQVHYTGRPATWGIRFAWRT
jgi:outer membrane receptor protein involved in Fe transport